MNGAALEVAPRARDAERDEADARALLRAHAMGGMIRVALTREPDSRIAARIEGERHATFLVRDRDGAPIGMGSRSVRRVWLEGRAVRMGYLGALRAAPGAVGIKRLRAGFDALRAARRKDELPFDLTAIVSDNLPARRLLERGLAGLPPYRPFAEIETLVFGTRPARRERTAPVRRAGAADRAALGRFLRGALASRALAPVWDDADLGGPRSPGLALEDFAWLERGGEVAGCAAVWDQRAFKQAVIAGYAPWLARVRPVVSLALRAIGQPALPPAGSTLAMGYVSHFATAPSDLDGALALIAAARAHARTRGIEHLALALAADDPLRAPLRRALAARPYRSTLYAVCWEGGPLPPVLAHDALPYVEAATL